MLDMGKNKIYILAGIIALLAALWAGLLRLGWYLPVLQPALILAHGPLMVSGFLGTLIALERAVALKRPWTYASPTLTALGSLALIAGLPFRWGAILISLGSLGLVAIFAVIVRRHPAPYTYTMAAGSLAWLVGNLLWAWGWPIYHLVLWWAAFLILTIAGERLELSRIIRLPETRQRQFYSLMALFGASLVLLLFSLDLGTRLAGVALLGLSIWLLSNDISRRTVRQHGLPRYAAICLLAGYAWLGIGGIFGIIFGGVTSGFQYDALLHSLFLGFVISMIFAHAPIIFPSVLGLPIRFRPVFYAHLILLHASLVLRVVGDLVMNQPARLWGGLLNEIAVLIFLGLTVASLFSSKAPPEPIREKAPVE